MGKLLRRRPAGAAHLRGLLADSGTISAPGAYDPFSARLIEAAGFPVVYMTGFGTSASLLGRPDVGLLTMTEMIDNARRIVEAVDIPVIADAETGYGGVLNVVRTIREYEAAGVAGVHIEDQVAPKRCGHITGKKVIPAREMVAKIAAADTARTDPDFLLIARTDARAVEGLDRALERARCYRDAGADMLFVEAPESYDEIAAIAQALPDVPLLFNWVEGGRTPAIGLEALRTLGYRLVIFPLTTLFAATKAIRAALSVVATYGTPVPALNDLPAFDEFLEVIGLDEVHAADATFAGIASDAAL
jgi:2-methylisocitrate lyase-like PEP mutase family enzyme